MTIFAAHNPDAEIRRDSSAGGIFSMLAERELSDGGAVYGASFDSEWHVRHMRIDNADELWRLRGSKYVFSDIKPIQTEIERDIEFGRKVLFSGTPCQVAAIRKRFGDNPAILLVETVCHGAPQPEYWQHYLDELSQKLGKTCADIETINFRDKRTGWKNYSFTIQFKDGKTFTQLHADNLYMRAFLQNLTLRKGCFVCPFKYPDGSHADITLGDFWGISQLAPEIDNDLGTTIVIARTERGAEFTDYLNQDYLLSLEKASQYNPAITNSATEPREYGKFQSVVKTSSFFRIVRRYTSLPLWLRLKRRLCRLMH